MSTPDRPIRDCTHPNVKHEHGTRIAYVRDRCRCEPCTTAATEYEAKRRRLHLYGRYDALVDATPVREHLLKLSAAGMTRRQIERVSGVDRSMLSRIINGRTERNEGPAKRIRKETAEKLLNLRYTEAGRSEFQREPAEPFRRRAQALACMGYPMMWQARYIGMNQGNYWHCLNRKKYISHRNATLMRDMYERFKDVPNEPTEHYAKAAATRARNTAKKNHWAPPAMWDDIDLDPWPVDDRDAHEVLLCLRDGLDAQETAEALGYTHPNALMSHLNYKGYRPRNGTPSLTARMAYAALGNAIREEVRAA